MSRIGPDELQDPPTTLAEKYARASNSGHLSPKTEANSRSDLDLMLAAAFATRKHPEWVAALQVQRMIDAQDTRDMWTIVEYYSDDLAGHLSRKGRKQMPKPARVTLILSVVHWMMHMGCDYCGGTGVQAEEGTAGTRTNGCSACHSTGVRPLSRVVPSAHGRTALWLVDEINKHSREAIKEMASRLNKE